VLLAAPVVAAVAWLALRGADAAVWRRALLASAAALIAGLLPLLYLPLAARGEPPLAWGDPRTLSDVLALLARRDFGGGTLMSPAIVVDQVLTHGESASPLGQRNLLAFWADVPRSFGIVFPALALLGLGWAVRRWRLRPLAFAGLACLALVTLFFMRVNTPRLPLYVGVTERFFILPHIVLALFTGCGAARLAEMAERARLPRAAALTVAALLTGVAMLPVNARPVSQRGNTFTRDFGLNLLAGVPEHARYFASGDLFHNSVLYAQHGLHRRRDVSVIEQDLVAFPWYARQLRRRGTLRLPERSSGDSTTSATWLELNAGDGRPAAAVKFIDDTYRARWELVPRGIVSVAHSRAEAYDIAARERALTDVVRTFDLTSLERRYQPESWEISEGVFYAYAVGVLRGMRDVAGVTGTKVDWTPVAAIAKANKWSGRLAAEYRAQRADFIRQSLEEPRLHLTPDMSRRLATVAVLAAESALEQDRRNLQALRTLAQLKGRARRALESPRRAAPAPANRGSAAGDIDELMPYFALAARIPGGPTLRDPEISQRAAPCAHALCVCSRSATVSIRARGSWTWRKRGLPMLAARPVSDGSRQPFCSHRRGGTPAHARDEVPLSRPRRASTSPRLEVSCPKRYATFTYELPPSCSRRHRAAGASARFVTNARLDAVGHQRHGVFAREARQHSLRRRLFHQGRSVHRYWRAVNTATATIVQPFPKVEGSVSVAVPDGAGAGTSGGSFTSVGGVPRSSAARILADGSVSEWNPNVNGAVHAIAVSGGLVYLGGWFGQVGPYFRTGIAQVDATTGYPTTWFPGGAGFNVTFIKRRCRERFDRLRRRPIHEYRGTEPLEHRRAGRCDRRRDRMEPERRLLRQRPHRARQPRLCVRQLRRHRTEGPRQCRRTGCDDRHRDRLEPEPGRWRTRNRRGQRRRVYRGRLQYHGRSAAARPRRRRHRARQRARMESESDRNRFLPFAGDHPHPSSVPRAERQYALRRGLVHEHRRTSAHQYCRHRRHDGGRDGVEPARREQFLSDAVSQRIGPLRGWGLHLAGWCRAQQSRGDRRDDGHGHGWNPSAGERVNALAVTGNTVYAGGWFITVGAVARKFIAAIDATTGVPTSWNPSSSNYVYAIAVSGNTVYGGRPFRYDRHRSAEKSRGTRREHRAREALEPELQRRGLRADDEGQPGVRVR
jgi:hypothetical protein